MYISSAANPRIKHIRKLSDRKYREHHQQFFCEGLRVVGEALERDVQVEMLVVSPDLLFSDYAKRLLENEVKKRTPIVEVSADLFRRISSKDGPRGLALVGKQNWVDLRCTRTSPGHIWVALDSIQDPGNLGTILRTTDACGCKGIILLDNCADAYDPATIRASMGSVFTQQLIKSSFCEFSEWIKMEKVLVVAAAGASPTDFRTVSYQWPLVLMMGSEREGLKKHHLDISDQIVSIPMRGRVDSLNVAVATGIILYEIIGQLISQDNGVTL